MAIKIMKAAAAVLIIVEFKAIVDASIGGIEY
jgi:hypothetical protein